MNSDFSRIITLLRKERKISQKKAAADLGISQALLSHYEKGIRECGLEFLVRISEYYSVSCDYLLGLSPEPRGRVVEAEAEPDRTRDRSPEAAMVTFNKKILFNSISMLFLFSLKSGSSDLNRGISRSLSLMIYKLFRIVFSSNSKNDENMFAVSDKTCQTRCDAALKICEGDIISAAEAAPGRDELLLGSLDFVGEYSQYSSSMLNLIKNCEASIKELDA